MSDVDAPSNAQAYAQALLTIPRFSNARTYARDLEQLITFFLKVTVSNAGGGAANA